MITLARGLSYLDLHFGGVPRAIATAVVHGAGGVALIDPGPSSTLATLRASLDRAGIAIADVDALLLTHIHLDHAGASGTLVRENPRLRVYVHEKGAPHMADPVKLLSSAERLYGDAMKKMWGEVLPVPADRLAVLSGGERVRAGGRDFEVAYTPGHAVHHVSYFNADAGMAFVGDTAGLRANAEHAVVVPAAPPPDIDLEDWRDSLARIEAWGADTLFVTHFGPHSPVSAHLRAFSEALDHAAELVRRSLSREGTDQAREAWFTEEFRRALQRTMSRSDAEAIELVARLDLSWRGLARYWRKRGV